MAAHLKTQARKNLVYVPIGDSYTIGTSVEETERWPNQLVAKLNSKNRPHMLPINPARNGYTTVDVINHELPIVRKLKPDLVTLLIGVNDWVRGSDEASFRENIRFILDELQTSLNKGGKVIVLTIPDFSARPKGKNYARGRNITEGITRFNRIVQEEASNRKIVVVDVFSLSQGMARDSSLVASDQLHPSGKEYQLWAELVLQNYWRVEIKKAVKKNRPQLLLEIVFSYQDPRN